MGFNSIEGKEKGVLIVSVLLVTVVFSIAIYNYAFPKEQVWEVKVFEAVAKNGTTIVSSYGGGYMKLKGEYELIEGATYRITYISRTRNWADVVIDIELLEG